MYINLCSLSKHAKRTQTVINNTQREQNVNNVPVYSYSCQVHTEHTPPPPTTGKNILFKIYKHTWISGFRSLKNNNLKTLLAPSLNSSNKPDRWTPLLLYHQSLPGPTQTSHLRISNGLRRFRRRRLTLGFLLARGGRRGPHQRGCGGGCRSPRLTRLESGSAGSLRGGCNLRELNPNQAYIRQWLRR